MDHNPVRWFELYVTDIERAKQFYETVFQLQLMKLESPIPEMEMLAFPMQDNAPGASGALVQMPGVPVGGGSTLIYFASADCDTEAHRIEGAGGKLQQPKTPIGPYGFMALGVDTEGNMFGLHSMA